MPTPKRITAISLDMATWPNGTRITLDDGSVLNGVAAVEYHANPAGWPEISIRLAARDIDFAAGPPAPVRVGDVNA